VNIFQKIRDLVWRYYFRKEAIKLIRDKRFVNLEDAKTVGILYTIYNEYSYNKVCEFVKYLQDRRKNVKVVGLANRKLVPHYCIPKLSWDLLTKDDINWYYKPKRPFVADFIKEPYDMLIDLSLEDQYPLQYIAGLSKAKFKVGRAGEENTEYYDMMIETNEKTTIDEFIKHIMHYLTVINNKYVQ
jgi:hypothetical protein